MECRHSSREEDHYTMSCCEKGVESRGTLEIMFERKLTIRHLADYPQKSPTTVHSVCERHSSNQSYTENYQRSNGLHRSR
jgi:hypothetical protein